MPTYEYACKACGEHLEVVQSFKDEALDTCPACGGRLRRVFGNIGITFKGSGFYKTDSRAADRSKSKSAAPAASKEAASSSSESSGTGSEKSAGATSGTAPAAAAS